MNKKAKIFKTTYFKNRKLKIKKLLRVYLLVNNL